MTDEKTPRRAHVLTLDMGADNVRMLIADLRYIATQLERGEITRGCMGGPSSGYSYTYSVDESWTHDRYFAAIDDRLERNKDAE